MLATKKIFKEIFTKTNIVTRSTTSIYDIQEKTVQERSPYTKKPSNIFRYYECSEKDQLNKLMLQENKKKDKLSEK